MVSEGATEGGLVALYAARVQAQQDRERLRRPGRVAPPVRSFGRTGKTVRRPRVGKSARVSALVATGLIVGTQAASAATVHQVQPGETLSQIASEYQVTVDQLAQGNSIPDPNFILAGSVLNIGSDAFSSPSSQSSQPAVKTHHVAPGETLTTIAQQYGLTAEALAQTNGIKNIDFILAGSDLTIPAVGASATKQATVGQGGGNVPLHLVTPGETLTTIANQYGITASALAAANGITNTDLVKSGDLLRIPGSTQAGPVHSADGSTKLRGMPVQEQALPLSCEAAALSEATAYWGNQVSEWVFTENMPYDQNPHLGFRGRMTGAFGGTKDYGVYAEPLVPLLNRYGFGGDVFYANGDASQLKSQINQGRPVVVWITNMASVQTKTYGTDQNGARFALVPQEHAVVVYGYDAQGVFVADPGDGQYRKFGWNDFMRSWGYFDGMSLAVYPNT